MTKCLTIVMCLSGLLLAGCRRQAAKSTILPADVSLRPGDVVFRQGEGILSRAVRYADGEGSYTHVGVVADSAGVICVIHAVPGEPDFPGDADRVKTECPERFFDADHAVCGAVYRPKDGEAALRAAQTAWRLYRKGVLFDHDYDPTDTTRMCCTQFVSYCFDCAGLKLTDSPPRQVDIPGLHIVCHFPTDLAASAQLQLIYTF